MAVATRVAVKARVAEAKVARTADWVGAARVEAAAAAAGGGAAARVVGLAVVPLVVREARAGRVAAHSERPRLAPASLPHGR